MSPRSIRLVIAAAAGLAGLAQAQSAVVPPPRPIGSTLARPMPGMSEPESKRAERAHHHKFQNGRDYTRDDSIPGNDSGSGTRLKPVSGPAAGARGATGASNLGGAGTGPARQKTDKGASSYFFGNDKK